MFYFLNGLVEKVITIYVNQVPLMVCLRHMLTAPCHTYVVQVQAETAPMDFHIDTILCTTSFEDTTKAHIREMIRSLKYL